MLTTHGAGMQGTAITVTVGTARGTIHVSPTITSMILTGHGMATTHTTPMVMRTITTGTTIITATIITTVAVTNPTLIPDRVAVVRV